VVLIFAIFLLFLKAIAFKKSAKSSETQYFLSDWIIVSNLLIIAANPTYGQLHTGVVIAGNPTYGQLHTDVVIAGKRTYRQLHGNRR
jgi:hypothetical protein